MPTRDHRLDRAKGILIFAVVLGHLLARTSPWDSDVLRAPMYLIYSFHMPAFVFLAGITAKSTRMPERVLTFLVLLGTVLPLLWGWMWVLGLDPDYSLLTPFWYSWFLLSMACWLITVPFIERFPHTILVASVVVGLFGGLLPLLDTELSASRSMIFWPFFVVGKLYGKQILDWAGRLHIWQKLFFTIAALGTIGYFYLDEVDHGWFYGSKNFDQFAVSIPEGVGIRLIVDIGALLMTLMLLMWVGEKNNVIAKIGRHSLAIYVIHGFVVRGLQPALDDSLDMFSAPIVFLICLALALLTTCLLSWTPFERGLRWYGSTVTQLLLRPFEGLRPKPGKHSELTSAQTTVSARA